MKHNRKYYSKENWSPFQPWGNIPFIPEEVDGNGKKKEKDDARYEYGDCEKGFFASDQFRITRSGIDNTSSYKLDDKRVESKEKGQWHGKEIALEI